jgi:hypothetical protein
VGTLIILANLFGMTHLRLHAMIAQTSQIQILQKCQLHPQNVLAKTNTFGKHHPILAWAVMVIQTKLLVTAVTISLTEVLVSLAHWSSFQMVNTIRSTKPAFANLDMHGILVHSHVFHAWIRLLEINVKHN